jgi:hypothetical protein
MIDVSFTDKIHIDGDGSALPSASARLCLQIGSAQRISEETGVDLYNVSVPNDRLPAFEFIYGEIYTLPEKHLKCTFKALVVEQPFEVSIFTTRKFEHFEIRTFWIFIYGSLDEFEKIGLFVE